MSGGLAETVRWFLVTTAELVVLFLALSFLVGLLQAWLPSIPCGNRARGTTALGSTATTACRSTPTKYIHVIPVGSEPMIERMS